MSSFGMVSEPMRCKGDTPVVYLQTRVETRTIGRTESNECSWNDFEHTPGQLGRWFQARQIGVPYAAN